MNFKYRNTRSCYKVEREGFRTVDTLNGYICFGRLTRQSDILERDMPAQVKYEIKISKDSRSIVYCPLSLEMIKDYLDEMRQYVAFEYNIVPKEGKDIYINAIVEGNRRKHLFVLNAIRHVYDFPFPVFVNEVFNIRNSESALKNESIHNLLMIIASCFESSGSWTYAHDQSFGCPDRKITTIKQVRARLARGRVLSTVFPPQSVEIQKKAHKIKLPKSDGIYTTEYWFNADQELINERIKKYEKRYNLLILDDNKNLK